MTDWLIIPGRQNSKGLPYKNRKLFNFTADIIPAARSSNVIVTSDDEVLLEGSTSCGFESHRRSATLSTDEASLKDVLLDVRDAYSLNPSDTITLLLLTYPQRTWAKVEEIISFFKESGAHSLYCAEEIEDHPFLCMYSEPHNKGRPVVPHDLYRRQDYPHCFRTSLYVGIFKVSELPLLSDRLINSDTIFYDIENTIDVDEEMHYNNFIQNDSC